MTEINITVLQCQRWVTGLIELRFYVPFDTFFEDVLPSQFVGVVLKKLKHKKGKQHKNRIV